MGKSSRKELKEYLKERFGKDALSPAAINQFMESQSRDLLFCLRCMNLVRGMNRDLGGSTVDRFIAFGAAASRGAKLSTSVQMSPAAVVMTKDEADLLMQADSDILAAVKGSLNQPVASEVRALERRQLSGSLDVDTEDLMLLPRSFSDMFESYKMSLRTWYRGLIIDLFVMLSGNSMDTSSTIMG